MLYAVTCTLQKCLGQVAREVQGTPARKERGGDIRQLHAVYIDMHAPVVPVGTWRCLWGCSARLQATDRN